MDEGLQCNGKLPPAANLECGYTYPGEHHETRRYPGFQMDHKWRCESHLCIKRLAISNEVKVEENIKKARNTLCSLKRPGIHEYNGLDPETEVHLYQTCVSGICLGP